MTNCHTIHIHFRKVYPQCETIEQMIVAIRIDKKAANMVAQEAAVKRKGERKGKGEHQQNSGLPDDTDIARSSVGLAESTSKDVNGDVNGDGDLVWCVDRVGDVSGSVMCSSGSGVAAETPAAGDSSTGSEEQPQKKQRA